MVVANTSAELSVVVVNAVEGKLGFELFELKDPLIKIESRNVEYGSELKVGLNVG